LAYTTEEIKRWVKSLPANFSQHQKEAIFRYFLGEKDFGGVSDEELKRFLLHLTENKRNLAELSPTDVEVIRKKITEILQSLKLF
jgi:hypothetical protein